MAQRMQRGTKLFHQSFEVTKANKYFFVISLASSITYLILITIAVLPLHHYEKTISLTHLKAQQILWLYLTLALFIFFAHISVSFYSMALIASTIDYFKQGTSTLKFGFKMACQSFVRMFLWVLFASTIGIFIFIFQGALKKYKIMQDYLIESNWNIATHLILPVLVIEKLGPLQSLKRSSHLIYETWGLSVRPNFGYTLYFLLARLIALIPLIIGIYFGGAVNITIGAFTTGTLFTIISAISMSTHYVITSAIYLYAAEKIIPAPFDEEIKNTYVFWDRT